ncbi:MAG TPA: response regulator [Thermoanaerobaculia bacterium]|nr:response regulator [Thermoanaerobaculia bacterium]
MPEKPIILVVDDDQPILLLMRSLLKEFGFEAVTAENGNQALAAARERRPAVVLVDKNMPGMTGAETIQSLRDEPGLERLPILILSGEPVSRSELAGLRADGAVLKPFDVTALVEQIRAFVADGDGAGPQTSRA